MGSSGRHPLKAFKGGSFLSFRRGQGLGRGGDCFLSKRRKKPPARGVRLSVCLAIECEGFMRLRGISSGTMRKCWNQHRFLPREMRTNCIGQTGWAAGSNMGRSTLFAPCRLVRPGAAFPNFPRRITLPGIRGTKKNPQLKCRGHNVGGSFCSVFQNIRGHSCQCEKNFFHTSKGGPKYSDPGGRHLGPDRFLRPGRECR